MGRCTFGVSMDDKAKRAMKDRHSRDEAEMRRVQQHSAGDSHSPVEAYAQHGAQSVPSHRPADAVVGEYEAALRREHEAWQLVKSSVDSQMLATVWQQWRAAVEARDKATRMLINE